MVERWQTTATQCLLEHVSIKRSGQSSVTKIASIIPWTQERARWCMFVPSQITCFCGVFHYFSLHPSPRLRHDSRNSFPCPRRKHRKFLPFFLHADRMISRWHDRIHPVLLTYSVIYAGHAASLWLIEHFLPAVSNAHRGDAWIVIVSAPAATSELCPVEERHSPLYTGRQQALFTTTHISWPH